MAHTHTRHIRNQVAGTMIHVTKLQTVAALYTHNLISSYFLAYTDKRKNDESYIEVSPSVTEGLDEEELTGILDACELSSFEPEMARIFETAIERLFYSDSFRVGNATLPQSRVRHRLHDLDSMTLRDTEQRLRANQEHNIRNSIQYTMAVLFNCITEGESDLIVDPYLNSLGGP